MTIKERAVQRYKLHDWMSKPTRDAVKFARKVFIEIATEQKEIDIQRAVEWHCGECILNKAFGRCQFPNNSCEELPSLIKAMKGE